MKKELANIIFSKMPESWDADKDRRIMEYLENNLLDPNDAFAMLNGFMKSNHEKIKKWAKYVRRGNRIPTDVRLYDRIVWDSESRKDKYLQIPAYVNVYCCNDPDAYFYDVIHCHPYKDDIDEYEILRYICDAQWLIAKDEHNKCTPALKGQVTFVKVGWNRFKLLYTPMRDRPGDPNLGGKLEIYDDGQISIYQVSCWYGIGNSCMDNPVSETYRYIVPKNFSTGIFISLFTKILPHIQTYLDQVEKLYDDKYAREDSSFFRAVKDYLDYTDDCVGMTFDEKGRSMGWQ